METFYMQSGRIKYLDINLTKDMQDSYSENLLEEINKWKSYQMEALIFFR